TDKVLLIVEDDLRFSKIIIEKAHENDLKAVVATNYLEVFDFINRFNPLAITLDIKLPDTSGWKIIDLLRIDLNYRHIPIYVISEEGSRTAAMRRGARGFMLKPTTSEELDTIFDDIRNLSTRETFHVLVIEDNEPDASQIAKTIRDDFIKVDVAATGHRALELM